MPPSFTASPSTSAMPPPSCAWPFQPPSSACCNGWTLPAALLRPLEVLFVAGPGRRENFLAGLRAGPILGARVLGPGGPRALPVAWVGVRLAPGDRPVFRELQGGCWVRGFPAVGRGRELLRAGGFGDTAGLDGVMRELGVCGGVGAVLYFNFHYDDPAAGCERVYLLDAEARCVHALALPLGALTRTLRACA